MCQGGESILWCFADNLYYPQRRSFPLGRDSYRQLSEYTRKNVVYKYREPCSLVPFALGQRRVQTVRALPIL